MKKELNTEKKSKFSTEIPYLTKNLLLALKPTIPGWAFVLVGSLLSFFISLKITGSLIKFIDLIVDVVKIVMIFRSISLLVSKIVELLLDQGKIGNIKFKKTLPAFYKKMFNAFLTIVAAISILSVFGVDVRGLLAGLGLGGLAISLAAKDTLSNIIAGIEILSDDIFEAGDTIQVGEVEGDVENIGMRSCRIRAYDHTLIYMPNSLLANEAVVNISRMGKRRIMLNMNLSSKATAKEIIELRKRVQAEISANDEYIQEETDRKSVV